MQQPRAPWRIIGPPEDWQVGYIYDRWPERGNWLWMPIAADADACGDMLYVVYDKDRRTWRQDLGIANWGCDNRQWIERPLNDKEKLFLVKLKLQLAMGGGQ